MNLKERTEQKQFRASDYHSARSLKFTTFVCPKIFTKQLSGFKNNCGVSPDSGGVDLNKKDSGNVNKSLDQCDIASFQSASEACYYIRQREPCCPLQANQ